MTASEHFKSGRLRAALDAQLQAVKDDPGDPNRRLFLFELAAFAGDLDRAKRQMDAVKYEQPELQRAVEMYRSCVDAEQARRNLFSTRSLPATLGESTDDLAARLAALECLRSGKGEEAAKRLADANDALPPLTGLYNEKPFTGLRDGDDLLAGVLEVFGQGRYFWVPLTQVESVQTNAPQFPRDLLWLPARLVTKGGPAGDVFLPALYPNSHENPDDALRLGRSTDWATQGGMFRGLGGKTVLVGDDAVGLIDTRELQILN